MKKESKQNETIIDVSGRKNIEIIYPEKEVVEYIDNRATLDIITGINEPCTSLDPFATDTIVDCLTCDNSDYKIVLKDGTVLKDYKESPQNGQLPERYVIEFFEDMKNQDISTYLNSPQSDYRITRDSDRIILRASKLDRKTRLRYQLTPEMEDLINSSTEQELQKKDDSFIKKITKVFTKKQVSKK